MKDEESLQNSIDSIDKTPLNIEQYKNLINKTTKSFEFEATIFFFDHMKQNKISPDEEIFQMINRLHKKEIQEKNTLKIPNKEKRKLQPKRRIHKIMKGQLNMNSYQEAKNHLPAAKKLLKENPEVKEMKRFKIIDFLAKELKIEKKEAKNLVTALKRAKVLISN
jgi:hypothetical protein